MTVVESDIYYDPYDYAIDENPHPLWKRMRDEAPLYYNDKYDFYAVTRYADVREMSADWRTYSSHQGSVLELIRAPDLLEQIRSILFEDPPLHDVHRGAIARAFTRRRIAGLEERTRELCRGFLDPLIGESGFDFVRDLASRLPMMVIGSLLGVPEQDQELVRSWADESITRDEGETDFRMDGQLKMQEYFAALLADRRQQPRDDLISALTVAEVEDDSGSRRLDDGEILRFVGLLAAAGNETTTHLISNSGKVLADYPDQRRLLVDNPTLIPAGIEEMLRFEPPSPINARVVTRDVRLHGKVLPQGAALILIVGSAGRDERAWPTPDPDIYDLRRESESHVSFGHGIHFCLGAALARLEGKIALEEVLARFPEWEVDAARAERVHTSTVRGWATLPVTV
ncbi:MAG TPA: cytochrome P450 [Mycobacteriales bacterium]|jgi:cytochrome P450|nr:cytochrome P450 [Mycobacteriales bacterium]